MTEAIQTGISTEEGEWHGVQDQGSPVMLGLEACPKCASRNGQWRGYRTRKDGSVVHRRWCRDCGTWFQKAHTQAKHAPIHAPALIAAPGLGTPPATRASPAMLSEHLAYDAWTEAATNN